MGSVTPLLPESQSSAKVRKRTGGKDRMIMGHVREAPLSGLAPRPPISLWKLLHLDDLEIQPGQRKETLVRQVTSTVNSHPTKWWPNRVSLECENNRGAFTQMKTVPPGTASSTIKVLGHAPHLLHVSNPVLIFKQYLPPLRNACAVWTANTWCYPAWNKSI